MKKNYSITKQKLSLHAVTLVICLLFVNAISAQKNIGWKGTNGANWSVASNWNYSGVSILGSFAAATTAAPNPTITLASASNDISVGDKVSGYGIPYNAVIATIDAADKTKITISPAPIAAAAAPGVSLKITFVTPKATASAPTFLDIAEISNGTSPNLNAVSYSVAGLTVGNATGPVTGSTLTIPSGVDFSILSASPEALLLKGGNIVNNGTLNVTSGYSGGTANANSGYTITCGLPEVIPAVDTEYTYSGTGALNLDTTSANNFSGGFFFAGHDANANKATYKFLFNGTADFLLSQAKAANGSAGTHLMRAVGVGALNPACKIIIGGAGFNMGSNAAGATNGFISFSGGGVDVTIAAGTTINIVSDSANPTPFFNAYVFGANNIAVFKNNGTFIARGTTRGAHFGLSAQNNGTFNFINNGVFDIDVNSVAAGSPSINLTNNQGATLPADVNFTNTGTMTLKTVINQANSGSLINMTTFSGPPNFHLNNSGTLNLTGSTFSNGAKVFNPLNTSATGTSRLTNSGTINTNQEFRSFYTINTSTGKITFLTTNTPTTPKFVTLTVANTVVASAGDTYTDPNMNLYTVVLARTGTATTLLTNVVHTAITPLPTTTTDVPPVTTPTVLTRVSGTGDLTINYTAQLSNNNSAFFQTTLNSGVINTNTGTTIMTNVTGVVMDATTSVLSPGGDSGRGVATFTKVGDPFVCNGTLKMQATGATTTGVDYDLIDITGTLTTFDISTATLDLTGIYIPAVAVTIDIIKTNIGDPILLNGGAIIGQFASVIGKPAGWSVNYTGGLGGKVQLVFDPALSTSDAAFSNFKFSYYPNPTKGQLNLSANKEIGKVELFNLLGQKVQSNVVNATQKQLNLSNLQKGFYLMHVTIDNAKKAFKIVKE